MRFVALLVGLLIAFPALTGPFDSVAGVWYGQAQYQASKAGQPVNEAHAVVQLAIRVEPGGKLVGQSPENGCQLLGLATPFVGPNSFQLDVTLSKCGFSMLNRRYTESLALNPKAGTLSLSLNGNHVRVGEPAWSFNVKATMTR
ncbi:MAG: hypothetical protein ACOZDY_00960 [Pseudomonadota bacterium]